MKTVYTHQKIDHLTGEVVESKFVKKEVKTREDFVLLYMHHIAALAKLPHYELKVLLSLAPVINWDSGDVEITAKIQQQLQETSGLTYATIKSAISRLAKKNLLKKVKNNWYEVNPEIFWRGSDIARQKQFSLTYQWTIE